MAKAKRPTQRKPVQRKPVQRKPKAAPGINYDEVRELARNLPAVEECTSYGTPALKVRGKLLARLKEDGQTLVLRTTLADRARLLSAAPDVFYLTDHYASYPWILIRLPQIDRAFLRDLLAEAWRLTAPARLVKSQQKESVVDERRINEGLLDTSKWSTTLPSWHARWRS